MNARIIGVMVTGVLLAVAGCKTQDQQAATNSAPAVVQAATATSNAPAPPALPPISGHWTITFKQLRQKKDGSFIPGTDKNIGVLNVDLKDGVYVIEGNGALCSQNGNVYKNEFHGLNFLVFITSDIRNDGKPNKACFTSVGSFDGSSGQLSRTTGVLAMADYEMKRQFVAVPDSPMEREVTLKIQSDDDSGSLLHPPKRSVVADAGVSGNTMSGEWRVALGVSSNSPSYGGTLLGRRTSD
jgi:hypothetical protein